MRFPFSHLVLKLLALFSFAGGPLLLGDALKPQLGSKVAFGVAFFPIAVLVVATLVAFEDEPAPFTRFLVVSGMGSAVALIGINVWALVAFAGGAVHRSRSLISFGIATGLFAGALYLGLAVRFLRKSPASGSTHV